MNTKSSSLYGWGALTVCCLVGAYIGKQSSDEKNWAEYDRVELNRAKRDEQMKVDMERYRIHQENLKQNAAISEKNTEIKLDAVKANEKEGVGKEAEEKPPT